jgi:hypothetical protein
MSIVHKNCRIAYGCTRTVWLIFDVAVKFPSFVEWRLFLLGLLANMQETMFSRSGWPELCPVIFGMPGGFFIIMKRARMMNRQEFDSVDLKSWVDRGEYTIPAEIKMDSFGYIDGRMVAVDYGN